MVYHQNLGKYATKGTMILKEGSDRSLEYGMKKILYKRVYYFKWQHKNKLRFNIYCK